MYNIRENLIVQSCHTKGANLDKYFLYKMVFSYKFGHNMITLAPKCMYC